MQGSKLHNINIHSNIFVKKNKNILPSILYSGIRFRRKHYFTVALNVRMYNRIIILPNFPTGFFEVFQFKYIYIFLPRTC